MSGNPQGLFDKRIAMRNIKHGRLSRKDYEQHLKGLKDAMSKAVPVFADERKTVAQYEDYDDDEDLEDDDEDLEDDDEDLEESPSP